MLCSHRPWGRVKVPGSLGKKVSVGHLTPTAFLEIRGYTFFTCLI